MAVKKRKKTVKHAHKIKKAPVKAETAVDGMKPETARLLMVALAGVAALVIMIMAAVALKPKTPAAVPADAAVETAVQPEMQNAQQEVKPDFERLFKEAPLKQEINKIDIEEAKYLFDSGSAVFVDARSQGEYDRQHIKGAVFLATNATNEEVMKIAKKYKNKVLVTYCHGSGCHLADKVAYRLFDAGHKKLAIFWGGWPKWDEHKYPESTGR